MARSVRLVQDMIDPDSWTGDQTRYMLEQRLNACVRLIENVPKLLEESQESVDKMLRFVTAAELRNPRPAYNMLTRCKEIGNTSIKLHTLAKQLKNDTHALKALAGHDEMALRADLCASFVHQNDGGGDDDDDGSAFTPPTSPPQAASTANNQTVDIVGNPEQFH